MTTIDRWSDMDLEKALVEVGLAIEWPTGRDMTGVVQARLADRATAAPSGWSQLRGSMSGRGRLLRRATILALAAILVLAALATAVGLGVPGIRLLLAPAATPSGSVPAPSVGASSPSASGGPDASSPSPSIDLLGTPIGLAEARARAGFGVLLPTDSRLGAIRRVGLSGAPPLARLAVEYGSGSVLTEFVGAVDPDAFSKIIGGGTTVEPLTINKAPAYWISGTPHEALVHYRLPDGTDRWETVTSGDVLIWTDGSVTLRLETPLGRAVALDVAQSVH